MSYQYFKDILYTVYSVKPRLTAHVTTTGFSYMIYDVLVFLPYIINCIG